MNINIKQNKIKFRFLRNIKYKNKIEYIDNNIKYNLLFPKFKFIV